MGQYNSVLTTQPGKKTSNGGIREQLECEDIRSHPCASESETRNLVGLIWSSYSNPKVSEERSLGDGEVLEAFLRTQPIASPEDAPWINVRL